MSKPISPKKLAEEISRDLALSKRGANLFIEKLFDKIAEYLKKGEAVKLGKIGTLKRVLKNQRNARNPKTGEKIIIPSHYTVRFKISKEFKEKLNEGETK